MTRILALLALALAVGAATAQVRNRRGALPGWR